jgi:hypothetical protein
MLLGSLLGFGDRLVVAERDADRAAIRPYPMGIQVEAAAPDGADDVGASAVRPVSHGAAVAVILPEQRGVHEDACKSDSGATTAEVGPLHAIDTARQLAQQLRAAEGRVAELETELESYRQEAERAEHWLHRIYTEIEDGFLRQTENRRGTPQRANGR